MRGESLLMENLTGYLFIPVNCKGMKWKIDCLRYLSRGLNCQKHKEGQRGGIQATSHFSVWKTNMVGLTRHET